VREMVLEKGGRDPQTTAGGEGGWLLSRGGWGGGDLIAKSSGVSECVGCRESDLTRVLCRRRLLQAPRYMSPDA
jgi:hypothetical protein